MVFAGTQKMKLGHVAVVRRIVSNREIRVDHANWGRDGNIYLNTPIIDVSESNDWNIFVPRRSTSTYCSPPLLDGSHRPVQSVLQEALRRAQDRSTAHQDGR